MKAAIYQLKRDYGKPIVIRRPVVNDVNVETGQMIRRYEIARVRRAIVLNNALSRSFVYDLTYVAANKNFAYGGYFDKNVSTVVIDKSDYRKEITTDYHIVIGNKRYEIVEVDADDVCHVVKIKMVTGVADVDDVEANNQ